MTNILSIVFFYIIKKNFYIIKILEKMQKNINIIVNKNKQYLKYIKNYLKT